LTISRPEAIIYVAIYAGLFVARMVRKSESVPDLYPTLAVVGAIFAETVIGHDPFDAVDAV